MFNLDAYRDDVEYAVFDDFDRQMRGFDFKMWMGGQLRFNCSDKYHRKRIIHWGKPSIYIHNKNPLEDRYLDNNSKAWLRGNCVIVEVTSALYQFDKPIPQ